jgi:hypothetical protein
VIGIDVGADEEEDRKYVVFQPQVDEAGQVIWLCYGENLREQQLPLECP